MISRLFIKNHLSFESCELSFGEGLNVFTGVSGAGKSVLMKALLSAFGLSEATAQVVEIDAFCTLGLDDISDESPNVFKVLKQNSARYFLNSQSISKKNLSSACASFVRFLGAKESGEFENSALLGLVDALVSEKNFAKNKADFASIFKELSSAKAELEKLKTDESHVEELKELASFEINKISQINPKIGELEELSELKKRLSKRDKIEQAWESASGIFELESAVIRALELCERDSAFFSDAMNELRSAKESLSFEEMSDDEIEGVLDRIEALSGLERRYGSIERALEVLASKKAELEKLEKIEFEKTHLQNKVNELNSSANALASELSKARKKALPKLEAKLNEYLEKMYLPALIFLARFRILAPCVLSGILAFAPVLLLFSLKEIKPFSRLIFSQRKERKSPCLCGLTTIKEKSNLAIKLVLEPKTAFIRAEMAFSSSSKSSLIRPL